MTPAKSDTLTPYGRALHDYFAGDTDATIVVFSDFGEHDGMPISIFFREPSAFFPFEVAALELCRGKVLDIGAGTGVHSLPLQERGLDVCAVEIVPEAVEIMRARGVRNVFAGDMFALKSAPADTVLMMMNGIGPVGTLDGLDSFLKRLPDMVSPGGQILVDSGDVRHRQVVTDTGGFDWPARTGDYVGEAWIRLEYLGEVGEPFRELYLDFDTLKEHADGRGWDCEQVFRVFDEAESYVARLTQT